MEARIERLLELLAAARTAADALAAALSGWTAPFGAAWEALADQCRGLADRFVEVDRGLAAVLEDLYRRCDLPPAAGMAELLARVPPHRRGRVEEEYRALLVSLERLRRYLTATRLVAERGERLCRRLQEVLCGGHWPGYGRAGRAHPAPGPATWAALV